MTKRVEEAVNNKKNGCNCAQAVACAFCDYAGISEDEMKKITQGFAAGMGNMEGSCGAIAGAAVVLGMANDNPGKVLRECNDCVMDAAMLLEAALEENN